MKVADIIEREHYTWVKVDRKKDDPSLNKINQWCLDTGCGKLVKNDTFSFKNESEITMFHLMWINE